MIDLSVLIVSYNTRELLDACLGAVFATVLDHRIEIIVVDNASRDGSPEMVRDRWPRVRLIQSPANVGFARAVNRGLAVAAGECLLLLNSDAQVQPRALDTLVEFLRANPSAAVAAPRLLNTDLTDQGTARAFPTAWAAIFGRKALLTRMFPSNPWSRR